jgi:ElaB/YqjD/DUF883 family membrane-anchored ribosome-binding protein
MERWPPKLGTVVKVWPQTKGMVERLNGRIEDVLQSHRFSSGENLEKIQPGMRSLVRHAQDFVDLHVWLGS